ncbi:MAG: hypothetical protein K0S57_93 [Ramlibacter sp.]|jgi:hypothetical protein|nr:hypothetical protein [Ramlibacter sp.]
MSFQSSGFLAAPAAAKADASLRPFSEELQLASEVNEKLMQIVWALKIPSWQKDRAMGALLFIRSVRAFQAAITLLRLGMCTESMAHCRSIVECTILMSTLVRDTSFSAVLEAEHERHRITQAEKIAPLHAAKGYPDADRLRELGKQKKPDVSYKLEELARKAGLEVLYQSIYRGTSGYAAHATLGALHRNLAVVEGLTEIRFGREYDMLDETLSTLVPLGLEVLMQVDQLFALGETTTTPFHARWQALCMKRGMP